MKTKHKKYILENINRKPVREIAKDLKLKEEKIRLFLEKRRGGYSLGNKWENYFKIGGLGIIFVAALIIRLYPVMSSPEKFRYGIGPYGDTHLYHRIAYNLYKSNGFSGTDNGAAYGLGPERKDIKYEPAVTRGPVYPFFMFGVYKLFGNAGKMNSIETWHENWDKVRIVQCILDAFVCLIVFFIVRFVYPASLWPALIAAGLNCLNFYNIFYTKALLSESITTFLLTGSIFSCILGLRYKKRFWWLLTGIGFGLTSLSRTEYILFTFLLTVFIFFVNQENFSAAVRQCVVFIIGGLIAITPWTMRNYLVFKKPIIISTGGLGFNLYLGTFESNKNWKGWGIFPDEIFSNEEEKMKIISLYQSFNTLMADGSIKIEAADSSFMQLALNRIQNNPVQSFRNWVTKIPRLWYQNYIPMYLYREPPGILFIFYFVFGLYAFLKSRGQEKVLIAPIFLLFVYLNLIFLPLHIEPRYGVALIPGIISLAGIGFWKALINIT